jgi:hypothetical protein
MNRGDKSMQSLNECGRWSVQEFVRYAVNLGCARCARFGPGAVTDNLCQGNSASGAAPSRYYDLRIKFSHRFRRSLLAWFTDEFAARRIH